MGNAWRKSGIKRAAQVALRLLTQRGIVAIPKSSHKKRMAQAASSINDKAYFVKDVHFR